MNGTPQLILRYHYKMLDISKGIKFKVEKQLFDICYLGVTPLIGKYFSFFKPLFFNP
jgi:hypothetical protein